MINQTLLAPFFRVGAGKINKDSSGLDLMSLYLVRIKKCFIIIKVKVKLLQFYLCNMLIVNYL